MSIQNNNKEYKLVVDNECAMLDILDTAGQVN